MKLTLQQVIQNPYVQEFINRTGEVLDVEDYTEHGFRHAKLVADRARTVAQVIGLSKSEQEMCAIAGYCHDMGNFLGRTQHHYWGAMLFSQLFLNQAEPHELGLIIQAIANHDKDEMKLSNKISAIVVLADKSDVHRSRVTTKLLNKIKHDIHDRVNYATTQSNLKIDAKKKEIKLSLKIDMQIVPIMEYFEIFTQRMVYCRKSAEYLGYDFTLEINKVKLL
ncbi:MAG: HD domain-containing protein [Patescibacteria group bacterium]|jgi:hypothetical protein|nr:HD domain-containing protein [Patescibacteria group bacterium]